LERALQDADAFASPQRCKLAIEDADGANRQQGSGNYHKRLFKRSYESPFTINGEVGLVLKTVFDRYCLFTYK